MSAIQAQDSTTGALAGLKQTAGALHVSVAAAGAGATETTLAAILAALTPGTNVHSSALEKSHVIAAAPCTLRKIVATNTGVADAWLLLFDLVALPANGTIPDRDPIPVPAGSPQGWESIQGTSFAVGCVAALSSTMGTLTLIGAAEALFNAEVV